MINEQQGNVDAVDFPQVSERDNLKVLSYFTQCLAFVYIKNDLFKMLLFETI